MTRGCPGAGGSVAIGYRRVSTGEQVNSGLGLEAQQAAIDAMAAKLALPLATTFTDAGLSGGLPLERRPALVEAVTALRKGDVLIVAKRDRLGRDVLNVAMCERLAERKGARIVSAAGEGTDDDGPASVLMRQIIDVFAQYERAIIRLRTKAALQAKKRRGERVGHIPYGLQLAADGRRLEPHPDEQQVLARLRELRAEGYSLRALAVALNHEGHRTRSGGRWYHQYVALQLDNAHLGGRSEDNRGHLHNEH